MQILPERYTMLEQGLSLSTYDVWVEWNFDSGWHAEKSDILTILSPCVLALSNMHAKRGLV